MSDLSFLFDKLVADKILTVEATGVQAESLRTSLTRKWTQKKERFEELGFLPDEWRNLAVSSRIITTEFSGKQIPTAIQFKLAPKKSKISYKILDDTIS